MSGFSWKKKKKNITKDNDEEMSVFQGQRLAGTVWGHSAGRGVYAQFTTGPARPPCLTHVPGLAPEAM